MTPKFTQEQFTKAKSKDLLELECEQCSKIFLQQKKWIVVCNSEIANSKPNKHANKYCSKTCQNAAISKKVIGNCAICNKTVAKQPKEFKKSKSGLMFCSSSCSAMYANTHKNYGTRVSKLEKWLAEKLIERYPQYEFHFNKVNEINAELDIFIPAIKLAFELNGIYHYEPIYGEDKLKRTQNNDNRKYQACLEKRIALCSINTSAQKRFTEKSSEAYLQIIEEVIKKHLDSIEECS